MSPLPKRRQGVCHYRLSSQNVYLITGIHSVPTLHTCMCGYHFTYPHIFLLKFISAKSMPPNIYVYTLPAVYVGHVVARLVEALLRQFAGSILDFVIEFFHWYNPSKCNMALELTQPLTEMSTRNIFWRDKGGRCVGLTTLQPSYADCLVIWEV